MIVERSMQDDWLSNAYLVADEPGGRGVIIDSGGPAQPLIDAIESNELTVEHLLLTHHHHDHVAENAVWKERYGVEILAHPLEAARLEDVDTTIDPGEELVVGGLQFKAIHTPGHTDGMLNFLVNDSELFTGDTLFKGSVGGVKAPGSTSFEDIRASIMDVLMALPHETVVRPATPTPPRSATSGSRTSSSGSGAGSIRRATRSARSGSSRPRSSCSPRITTGATRRGSAGTTRARTTSCRAARWSGGS